MGIDVKENHFDVLQEIGNIGAGNATTAISDMLGMKVRMEVPKVRLLSFQELGSAISAEEETIVAVYIEVQKDVEGSIMFLLKKDGARYLVNRLLGKAEDYQPVYTGFDEMELSVLTEMGNIVGGSYLSALSAMTNLVIMPSIPFLAIDMAAAILSVPAIQFGQYGDHALLIETKFGNEANIDGYFILLPEPDSFQKIMTALGISEE